jgi:hypothetical protein
MRKLSISRRSYARLAAAIFFLMAAYSGLRLILGSDYTGYTHDVIIDGLLVSVWTSAAIAMLVPRERSIYVGFLGLLATYTHAFLSALSLGWGALPYFVAFAVLIACLRNSYGLFHPGGLFEPPAAV